MLRLQLQLRMEGKTETAVDDEERPTVIVMADKVGKTFSNLTHI